MNKNNLDLLDYKLADRAQLAIHARHRRTQVYLAAALLALGLYGVAVIGLVF